MSVDPFSTFDGAYVLGALSASDTRDFEEHLTTCTACTASVAELRGLPTLLSMVPPNALLDTPTPAVPDTLLPRLLAEVRARRRRRRWITTGVAAAVAACLVAVTMVVTTRSDTPVSPQAAAMTRLVDAPVTARAQVVSVHGGAEVRLWCSYQATGYSKGDYILLIRGKSGQSQQLATWPGVPGQTMVLRAPTTWSVSEISVVEVIGPSGRTLLSLRN